MLHYSGSTMTCMTLVSTFEGQAKGGTTMTDSSSMCTSNCKRRRCHCDTVPLKSTTVQSTNLPKTSTKVQKLGQMTVALVILSHDEM
jgi:hypothetical protein